MQLNFYKEFILEEFESSDNFYVAGDFTSGSERTVIINSKNDVSIGVSAKIDYVNAIFFSEKTKNEHKIVSASPVEVCFQMNGCAIYTIKSCYILFKDSGFGLFLNSDFTNRKELTIDEVNVYKTLNDIILDTKEEYEEKTENLKITYEEWSWL